LTNYLNELIQNSNFIIICYSNFDFSKIRYNFILELLTQTHKYFNLTNIKFSYLKKLLTITFLSISNNALAITNKIKKEELTTSLQVDMDYINRHQVIVEYWEDIIATLKLNKPKKLLEKANLLYKFDLADKEKHKEFILNFAKSVAILIKNSSMIDIDTINEILGGKDDLCIVININ